MKSGLFSQSRPNNAGLLMPYPQRAKCIREASLESAPINTTISACGD
jgi:hypothetical protein